MPGLRSLGTTVGYTRERNHHGEIKCINSYWKEQLGVTNETQGSWDREVSWNGDQASSGKTFLEAIFQQSSTKKSKLQFVPAAPTQAAFVTKNQTCF